MRFSSNTFFVFGTFGRRVVGWFLNQHSSPCSFFAISVKLKVIKADFWDIFYFKDLLLITQESEGRRKKKH